MENDALFTHKELCLLLQTICKNELNVTVAKDIKGVRDQVDVFANDSTIVVDRVQNKQGKTKVSVFVTRYCGDNGEVARAYTTTT